MSPPIFMCSPPDEAAEYLAEPSPYVSPYMTRRQGEQLLALLERQPEKRWEPLRKLVRKALAQNAGGVR